MQASVESKKDNGLNVETILLKISDLFGADVAMAFQGTLPLVLIH